MFSNICLIRIKLVLARPKVSCIIKFLITLPQNIMYYNLKLIYPEDPA